MNTHAFRALGLAAVLAVGLPVVATAQFASFGEEEPETKWGATIYLGARYDADGEVDHEDNANFGIRGSYSMLEVDPIGRASPELGFEFRKNYLLLKAGGRADTRDFLRLSGFGSAGVLHMRDFTNDGDSDVESQNTWFVNFGVRLRMPNMRTWPIIGGLPLEDVSLFIEEEITGLEAPDIDRVFEHDVTEFYDYAIHVGLMVGTASGWTGSE